MGTARYVVIGRSSEAAFNELINYFFHDSKFKVLAVDKFCKYNAQVEVKWII